MGETDKKIKEEKKGKAKVTKIVHVLGDVGMEKERQWAGSADSAGSRRVVSSSQSRKDKRYGSTDISFSVGSIPGKETISRSQ